MTSSVETLSQMRIWGPERPPSAKISLCKRSGWRGRPIEGIITCTYYVPAAGQSQADLVGLGGGAGGATAHQQLLAQAAVHALEGCLLETSPEDEIRSVVSPRLLLSCTLLKAGDVPSMYFYLDLLLICIGI